MIEFTESNFYKSLQDFFINNNKETFLQMLAEFYNRTEGIIEKNVNQDELIKELRELYLEFNEKGIDENIVIEKVNYFVENNVKIKDILAKLIINTNKIEDNTEKLNTNTNNIKNIKSQMEDIAINVTNETELKNTIVNIKEGGTIQLKNDIDISTQIIFPKDIVLDGCGYKLKCVTDGLQDWLCFYGKSVVIKNVILDDNLKGRVIITGENVKKFNIKNCEFTGYTKEFGYYKTDGLIRIDGGCDDILISECKFHNSGYDYGNSDGELNRCISFNSDTIKNAVVKNCEFFKVNQGIVSISENLTVNNCVFDYVKDNSIYASSDILKVKDCLFSNANDEPIVTSCKINKITNNTFKDFSNKAIAIYRNDGITSDIINNTFINTLDSGQCLSYRDGSYYKNITFNNNTCILSSKLYSNPYPVITTLDSEVFNFKDNYIEVNQPINSSIVLSNSKKIIFEGNILKNVGTQNIALKSSYTDAILLINNNQCEKTRIPVKGYIIGNEIEPNASYIYNLKYNILFSEVKPNYNLPKGTIVYNINYSKITDTLCWISTGNEWLTHKINMPIKHTRSNTPINWSQPNYPGELWIGSEGSVWIGLNTDGQTTDSWKKLAD